jgi:hypothetical protein
MNLNIDKVKMGQFVEFVGQLTMRKITHFLNLVTVQALLNIFIYIVYSKGKIIYP